MPMLRLCAAVLLMSTSDTETVPESANSKPAAMRSAVVFPQPDGPSNVMSSPGITPRSSPSSATLVPNVFLTDLNSSAVMSPILGSRVLHR